MGLPALVFLYAALNAAGVVLLRFGLRSTHGLHAYGSAPTVLGAAFYASSFAVWALTLKGHSIPRAYPLFIGASYVAVLLASATFLGERVGAVQGVGILLVGVGVILMAR